MLIKYKLKSLGTVSFKKIQPVSQRSNFSVNECILHLNIFTPSSSVVVVHVNSLRNWRFKIKLGGKSNLSDWIISWKVTKHCAWFMRMYLRLNWIRTKARNFIRYNLTFREGCMLGIFRNLWEWLQILRKRLCIQCDKRYEYRKCHTSVDNVYGSYEGATFLA